MSTAQSSERTRARIATALRRKRAEIEEAALARAHSISAPADIADPIYAEGLRKAIAAAVDYGVAAVELGDEGPPPVPAALLQQARLAACSNVSLDTVLRRYVAGFNLFGSYVLGEAGIDERDTTMSRRLLHAQAAQFDRLLAAISEEYARARDSRFRSPQRRQAARVSRVLSGEPPEAVELGYEFEGWHVGAIAIGANAAEAARCIVKSTGCEALRVDPEDDVAWLWLRADDRRAAPSSERLSSLLPPGATVAVGEPAGGLLGWRLTHRQAKAAIPIARLSNGTAVRYGDVALLSAMLANDLLANSMHQMYLVPLAEERDGGRASRQTLRAYFKAERNVSSAAAALGLSRPTVSKRLRLVEERLGYPLAACATELELALRFDDLKAPAHTASPKPLPLS